MNVPSAATRSAGRALLVGLALASAAGLAGCTCAHTPPAEVDAGGPETAAPCAEDDFYACEWQRLLDGRGEPSSLARLIVGQPADLDALLRAMFPAIGDRPIVDRPTSVPAGLVFEHRGFEPYTVPVPVDWAADPYANNSWRLYFQGLDRLGAYAAGDARAVETGAALLVDWVSQVLYANPPLDQSWADHAVSMRLDAAARLTERYIADSPVLDRPVLAAAAQLILTHLYALASERSYVTAHNHSMMHDLGVLAWVRRYPALRDGRRMWEETGNRMIRRQVKRSVTEDGLHIENSGCYHLLYVELLNRAIGIHRDAGVQVPTELVRARDSMIEPLVQHLQPDLSFAQFGDCGDADQSARLEELLDRTAAMEVGDPSARAPLEWVVSRGERGVAPALDRVYKVGRYATFRDRWDPSTGAGTVGHFKVAHLSGTHYHADETAFEIFAHGRELVVGPGVFGYVSADPLWAYQRSPAGQNVLVVDDDATVFRKPTRKSRVVAHGGDGDVRWVQGTHANYAHLGVGSLVRTFALARPDTFIVIDRVRAPARHRYAQHFHLHPDVSRVRTRGGRTVLASVPGGPSLAIAAATRPDSIETPRGVADGDVRRGWYFPELHFKVPAYDVVFRHTGSDTVLPVVIVVSAPGEPARVPTRVAYVESDGIATLSWRVGGVERSFRVP